MEDVDSVGGGGSGVRRRFVKPAGELEEARERRNERGPSENHWKLLVWRTPGKTLAFISLKKKTEDICNP